MYQFKHLITGKLHTYKSIRFAERARGRFDAWYGYVVTTPPKFIENTKQRRIK
jgi:hypothetical protein